MGTNWFMPAFVNKRFGASGKSDDDGTSVCCFSRKKSRNDWRTPEPVMGDLTTDMPVAHWDKSRGSELIDVTPDRARLAVRRRFIKNRLPLVLVEPFNKHENMAMRLVHDIGRFERGDRRQLAANFT